MKRLESLYLKMEEHCPNKEAVPVAYTSGVVTGGGIRVSGLVMVKGQVSW